MESEHDDRERSSPISGSSPSARQLAACGVAHARGMLCKFTSLLIPSPNSPFLLSPPVWNHRLSTNSGRSTTGLLREFVCKYRRTKDLEVKIRETKELRTDFRLGPCFWFELDALPLLGRLSNRSGVRHKVSCHNRAVDFLGTVEEIKIPRNSTASIPTRRKPRRVGQPFFMSALAWACPPSLP
jgi:hypothetical protein